jgi:5-dehydro-2-deoxygluconokinase
MTMAGVPLAELETAPLVIVSGTLLAAEPARAATLAILSARLAARDRRAAPSWTILDLDWRPTLWAEPGDYPALIEAAAALSDLLIGSDTEFQAAAMEPGGTQTVVLKHGPDGVSLLSGGSRQTLPGIAVDVVCGIGSGDALTAAFAAGLLRGLDPLAALKRGNAAGAIVASRLMCSSAMPTPNEIDEVLS